MEGDRRSNPQAGAAPSSSGGQEALQATADAGANIALIKYWGARDAALNVPLNDSVSVTLDVTRTITTVTFSPAFSEDTLSIDGVPASEAARQRVSRHLDLLRARAGVAWRARVVSRNTFPMGVGIASSASAFAALTVAAARALGLDMDARELSRLARRGSGSAARSIYGGYVWWHAGRDDASSYAEQLAPPEHWALRDVIVIVEREEKAVSSAEGHRLAHTSPFLAARLDLVKANLPRVRQAILARDLATLGPIMEVDALAMHFVMMSSSPPLFYWAPATVEVIKAVHRWRAAGLMVYFTIDAGPNVHLICEEERVEEVKRAARDLPCALDLMAAPGPGPIVRS